MSNINNSNGSMKLKDWWKIVVSEIIELKNRIANIVSQSGDDITEIVDARYSVSGTTYDTLKDRLDAEMGSSQDWQTSSTHAVYVSTDGDDDNDGLTLGTAFKTIQKAVDYLADRNFALSMGIWKIDIADGTYDGLNTSKQFLSQNRIIIEGKKNSSNVPTVIIDGTDSSLNSGFSFNATSFVQVKDIKFTNWTASAQSCGLVVNHSSNLYALNVHADNITWSGINVNYNCRLYVQGGVLENCGSGIRVYNNSAFTIGYQGLSTRPQIKDCQYGVEIRDSSLGHVDYTDIIRCQSGIYCYNLSRVHVMGASVKQCTQFAIQLNIMSTWYNNTVIPNEFSGNAVLEINYGRSMELNRTKRKIYNPSTNQFINKFDDLAYGSANTNCLESWTSSGNNGLNVIGGESSTVVHYFGTPSNVAKHGFIVSNASNYVEHRVDSVGIFRIASNLLRAVTDNVVNLGMATFRWKEIFAGNSTINTSDGRLKQQVRDLSEAEKAVAVRIKGLIKAFKFNDAVEQKGDGARIHFGVIAQDVAQAFNDEGLDAHDYSLFCYDEWEEQLEELGPDGEVLTPYQATGNRYGIRYEQLLAFVISAM